MILTLKAGTCLTATCPALPAGANTLEELEAKLPEMIVELLELNEHLFDDKSRLRGSHSFRLVAHHEALRAIAA